MRLSARQTRHLDVSVSEVIVFGVISRPSLNVVTSVGAADGGTSFPAQNTSAGAP